jgi:putative ABC transport system substrate-binding protein
MMILFRGWEEACDGFRDYFAARRIPVELIVRDVAQDLSRVYGFVREAHETRPDLVYLWGTSLTMAALGPWDGHDPARHLTGIPVVFNIVTDPVGNRVVRSREAPGRPVTGTEYIAPVGVQLEAMSAYRTYRRIAAVFNPLEQNSVITLQEMASLLPELGAELIRLPVPLRADGRPTPSVIPQLVGEARRAGADWLYIPPDTFLNDHRAALTAAALAEGLPSFSASERFVAFADGLAGLVSRYYSVGAFTALKAEQILVGQRAPESIPVETLTRFSYLIRMDTARMLRAYPPVGLLRIAEPI